MPPPGPSLPDSTGSGHRPNRVRSVRPRIRATQDRGEQGHDCGRLGESSPPKRPGNGRGLGMHHTGMPASLKCLSLSSTDRRVIDRK